MTNDDVKIVNNNEDCKCFMVECSINSVNTCNICRQTMCETHSNYINKNKSDSPIICSKCMYSHRYDELIGAYVLHFNTQPSRFHNCLQRFWSMGQSKNNTKIKPI